MTSIEPTVQESADGCENLRRYLAGEPLMNLADAERGY